MDNTLKDLCGSLKQLMHMPSVNELFGFLEGETAFLYVLKNYGNKPATPSKLSDDLGVTKGRVTAIINSLTRKEMVRLENVSGDRRKVNVRITPKGIEHVNEKMKLADIYLNDFITRVGREKVEQLTALINDVTEAARECNIELE